MSFQGVVLLLWASGSYWEELPHEVALRVDWWHRLSSAVSQLVW